MIISFGYPSSPQYTGGVVALYEYANGLARRGHEVHFLHAPATPYRIDRIEELDWFPFHPAIRHHISDVFEEPAVPDGDISFQPAMGPRHGLPVTTIQGFGMIGGDLEVEAMRSSHPKLCVARWLLEVGRTLGVPAEQLWHVPYGIDHQRFVAGAPDVGRPVDVAVLHNLHPAKGWHVVEPALVELHRRRPSLRVAVFGIVEPVEAIPAWMEFHLAPDHAQLVADVYGASKVFVQPSLHEGFGFTAVEAMACGCALVTTDNGGSEDYAVHDETALVVPPGDAVALTDAIEALLVDDERRQRLAVAGERHVRRFDWDRSAELLEAHLERYLADPASFLRPPAEARPLVLPGVRGAG